MRLGKFVEHFKAAAVAADTKGLDPVLRYLAIGRQLGYAFYMTFDAMVYPDSVGIKKFEGAARLQREAYRAWFAGLMCNVIAGVYTLYGLQQRAREQKDSADAEKAVEAKKLEKYVLLYRKIDVEVTNHQCRERATVQLQLISDVCDLTVPSSGLGVVNLDDGVVGLAGTVSSLIGLYAAWEKTA